MIAGRRQQASAALVLAVVMLGSSSGCVASAASSKIAAFCSAETYLAANDSGGLPASGYDTVAQEKAELENIDTNLAVAAKDAPTPAFATLAKQLIGTFVLWIDDPTLLRQELTSGAVAPVPGLGSRLILSEDISLSRDFIDPIEKACPALASKSGVDALPDSPVFLTTPDTVRAEQLGFGAAIGSAVTSSSNSLRRPDVANIIDGAKKESKINPSTPVTVVGTPELSNGEWTAEYKVHVAARLYDVFVSIPDTTNAEKFEPTVTNVLPVKS